MRHPFISPDRKLPEITLKVILLSILLAAVLGVANTYLALKIGLLTSASIPAAMLSMGILRFFKHSNILENNLVQTAASAGEAIAGGVVYTVPALIILHYWTHFPYWETMLIALLGGILGVCFSIPLRRVLLNEPLLPFPEGRAIAEVLQLADQKSSGVMQMLLGGCFGALFQLTQNGLKLIANHFQLWFTRGNTLYGFGFGFSTTMIGAGYLIGANIATSIFIGAVIGWFIGIPVTSHLYNLQHLQHPIYNAMTFWSTEIRYLGIGAMLLAGVWTLLSIIKPFTRSVMHSLRASLHQKKPMEMLRTDTDIPMGYVAALILLCAVIFYKFLSIHFASAAYGFSHVSMALWAAYVIVIGFIASTICGYFSGLVGVSASPGSSVIIASLLIAALIFKHVLHAATPEQLKHAAAIAIILGAMITGAAAVANDNMQDLKVGQLLGATPWKQQVMLLLGAIVTSLIVPLVMEMLFNLYGIADVLPHPGMNPHLALTAPPAALMASITQGVFTGQMPWHMVLAGFVVILAIILVNQGLKRFDIALSVLGVAIGIYLPITTSLPLFLGGLLSWLCHRRTVGKTNAVRAKQNGLLLACGLIAGAALMDVLLAIPMAVAHDPNVWKIMPENWAWISPYFGLLSLVFLVVWFYWTTRVED